MKTILKIIIIGIIAGVSYKFLRERNISIEEKFNNLKEWVSSELKEFDKSTAHDKPSVSSGENNISPSYDSKSSSTMQPVAGTSSPAETQNLASANSGNPEGEEFLIDEKQLPGADRFPELDRYAAETPEEAARNLQSLAAWLTKPALNDLERTRLVFTWIATHIAYDDNGFNTGNYSSTEAEGVLRNRVSVCQGYSELFAALGKAAGLDAVLIAGYAKGISYSPDDGFSQTNHAWNAVRIEGEWKLFDVTWAAGYGTAVNGRLVSVKRFDDYWFSVRPDEFIFSHLPEDDSWQLNEQRITLSQFEGMPNASSSFFSLGFNGSQCFPLVMAGSIRNTPVSYKAECDIHVLSVPYGKFLQPGRSIKVRIRSSDAARIAFENNGRITDLAKNGNEYSGVITTTSGQLSLMATYAGETGTYHTFLEYTVE